MTALRETETERERDEREQAHRELGPRLATLRAPEPSPALVARTLRLAQAELRRATAPRAAPQPLVAGFGRELLRIFAVALPALALAAAVNLALLQRLPAWLGVWLPEPLALALTLAHAAGTLGWLALTGFALPVFAHRRALARL